MGLTIKDEPNNKVNTYTHIFLSYSPNYVLKNYNSDLVGNRFMYCGQNSRLK